MYRFLKEFIVLLLVAITIQVLSSGSSLETRKVVAVVDTGLPYNHDLMPYLCKGLQFDVTQQGIQDYHGHGTNILGLIAKGMNNKTHCLTMIKWWHTAEEKPNLAITVKRIQAYSKILLDIKPAYLNLSLSGFDYVTTEREMLARLLKSGTIITVAAGNDHQDLSKLCDVYPACYKLYNKNYHILGSSDTKYSNFGGPITEVLPGSNQCGIFGVCESGTSQSSALKMAELIKEIR